MKQEPVWIRDDVVLSVHARQIAEHGGLAGVRDHGLLQSALARPKQIYQYAEVKVDCADLAAAYACGIAHNHPFIDGNKRISFILCRLFLRLNGQDIAAPEIEKYRQFLRLALGELSEQDLASWIRRTTEL